MRNRALRRILCLCTATSFLLPILVSAVDAMVVNMVSPKPTESVKSRYVEVSVGFNTESDMTVTKLELWVNGRLDQKKMLVQPKTRGLVSFNWDSAAYGNGAHYLLVKLFSGAEVIATVTGTGNVGVTPYDVNPPTAKFENVKNGEVLSGVKQIKIAAKDDSGAPPMVSVFVDQTLKLLKNTPPFTYDLDTTTYADGDYQIETYAYDNAGNKSDAASVKVKIRNTAATTAAAPAVPAPVVAAPKAETVIATAPTTAPTIKAPTTTGAARATEAKPKTTGTAAAKAAKATKPAPADTNKRVVVTSKPGPAPKVEIAASPKVTTKVTTGDQTAVAKVEPAKIAPKPTVAAAKTAEKPTVAVAKTAEKPAAPKVQMAKVDIESSTITKVMIGKPAAPAASTVAEPVAKPAASIVITEKPVVEKVKPVAAKPAASVKPIEKPKAAVVITEKPASKPVVAVIPVEDLPAVTPTPKAAAKASVAAPAKKTVVALAPKTTKKVVGEGVQFRTVVKSAEKASLRTASSQLPSAGRIKMRDLVNKSSGTVLWDHKTKTVTAYVNNIKIELRIGQNLVKVNGKTMKVSLVPYIQNGRTILDVRLYHKALALAGKTPKKTATVPAK